MEDKKSSLIFDYKEPVTLIRYLSEGGKILPSRISGLSHKRQKELKRNIKKAQNLALLPLGTQAFNNNRFVKPISSAPFDI